MIFGDTKFLGCVAKYTSIFVHSSCVAYSARQHKKMNRFHCLWHTTPLFTFTPAFSASTLGNDSRLSANALMEYCSIPGQVYTINKTISHQ